MKSLLVTMIFTSFCALAAPNPTSPRSSNSSSNAIGKDKIEEPSAIPCTPHETRKEKLNDLAKLDGAGESHSTNCPAQGVIKEAPDAVPLKKVE